MNLSKLLSDAGFEYRAVGSTDIEISEIVSDSRRVCDNCLFLCIRGIKNDSHRYIGEACAHGAAALVVEEGHAAEAVHSPAGITIIYTKDTRSALARLWYARYELAAAGMRIVAVTGTNGKTTVSYMLRSIFGAAMHRCGLIGTVRCETPRRVLDTRGDPDFRPDDRNANMTTPDPGQLYRMLAAMRDDGAEYVFIEATSHALALGKLAPLRFAAAVITNLTPEHLDFHGDMENYFLAKASILHQSDAAVINADDRWGGSFLDYAVSHDCPCADRIILCSAGRAAVSDAVCERFTAENIRASDGEGVSYTLVSPREIRTIRCPTPGSFTVMNSLEAAACAMTLGVSGGFVADALAASAGTPGRLERVRLGAGFPASVFIDYAHTPDALENLLRTARGMIDARNACRGRQEGRVILLFGCGGDRDRKKRPAMGRIASRLADHTVITSDNSRSEKPEAIINEIMSGFDPSAPHTVEPDRRRAIFRAVGMAQAGDVILLAGKGHEQYEIDASGRHEFSEADTARDAVRIWQGEDGKRSGTDNEDKNKCR